MDYEQDDESGTFTLRIKSRSGESIYSFTEAFCRNMTCCEHFGVIISGMDLRYFA